MPYSVIKSKNKNDKRPYKIVKQGTNITVGTSKTMKDAVASVAHRADYEKEQIASAEIKKPITNKDLKGRNQKTKTK